MVAFANDYSEVGGGVIIIGVDPDTRSVVGLKGDPEETLRRITGLCRDGSIVPTIAPEISSVDRKIELTPDRKIKLTIL